MSLQFTKNGKQKLLVRGCNRFRDNQFWIPFVGYILSAGHGFLVHETVNVMMRFGETEVEIRTHQTKTENTAIYYLGQ